jgi:hypothetical protein
MSAPAEAIATCARVRVDSGGVLERGLRPIIAAIYGESAGKR